MMEKSWTIFRVRDIPVKLHVSLLVFLPYVAFVFGLQYRRLAKALLGSSESVLSPVAWGIVLTVALFAAIFLHELGHSLVALRNGVRVRSITLMMLGGVSSMESDVTASREAWMAFAGPLVSFGLAFVAYLLYRWTGLPSDVRVALLLFASTNAFVGVFNLLPAFPMDGGRVLRGLLAGRLGTLRATDIATRVGQVLAVVFAVWGFLTFNIVLMLIAVFVYTGASAERARLFARDLLHGVAVSQFMNDRLGDAGADENAADLARRLFENNWVGVRVLPDATERGVDAAARVPEAIGVITAWDLSPGRPSTGPSRSARDRMRTDLPTVRTDEDASKALELFENGRTPAVVVVDQGHHVVGLVTQAEVGRALALAQALGRGAADPG